MLLMRHVFIFFHFLFYFFISADSDDDMKSVRSTSKVKSEIPFVFYLFIFVVFIDIMFLDVLEVILLQRRLLTMLMMGNHMLFLLYVTDVT